MGLWGAARGPRLVEAVRVRARGFAGACVRPSVRACPCACLRLPACRCPSLRLCLRVQRVCHSVMCAPEVVSWL